MKVEDDKNLPDRQNLVTETGQNGNAVTLLLKRHRFSNTGYQRM